MQSNNLDNITEPVTVQPRTVGNYKLILFSDLHIADKQGCMISVYGDKLKENRFGQKNISVRRVNVLRQSENTLRGGINKVMHRNTA